MFPLLFSLLARRCQTHDSLCQCLRSALGPGVDPVKDVVCRIKTIQANCSCVSCVRQVLSDDPLNWPLFQSRSLSLMRTDRWNQRCLTDYSKTNNSYSPMYQLQHAESLQVGLLTFWLVVAFLRLVVCLFSCVQKLFCRHPSALPLEMKYL